MMLFPLLPIAIVVLVVVAASRTPRDRGSSSQALLDERFADGEMSPDEHARRSGVLAETWTRRRRPTGVVAIGAAAAGLLLVVAMWGGAGWGGAGWGWPDGLQMTGHMTSTSSGTADAPVPEASTIEVVATDLRFDPTTVTITAGDTVNLALVNDGRAFHDLTIPALGFLLDAEAGGETSGSLTVDEPGTYEFECSVPGHAEAGMRGTLIVESGGSS
jgi:nitrite reductase (NO-forming)